MAAKAKQIDSTVVEITATPPVAPIRTNQLPNIHDPEHQAILLREALQSDKVRIGYFLGAGCPLGIFDAQGEKSLGHIPDVAGLTQSIRKQLEAISPDGESLCKLWDKLCHACTDEIVKTPNVEHILSELRTLCGRRGKSSVDEMSKEDLTKLDTKICELIAKEVGKPLPKHRCAYHRFASWVGGLQRVAPVELFTPNYDLLLEEAFEQQRIPHFDGFVGAREPFFDIASIEQDAIPSRWTRLWKLHGSINWQKGEDGTVFRVTGTAAAGKAMIYPSHLKYDQSRRMPYLAMLDRLKAFFRIGAHSQGFGPPVLVVCGYSFCDDHLNEVLLDGLRGNRSSQCFVLVYKGLADSRDLVKMAERQPNLSVLAWDGAVIGTREGRYQLLPDPSNTITDPWHGNESVNLGNGSGDVFEKRCRLGDFHYFSLFLEHLCGGDFHENTQHGT